MSIFNHTGEKSAEKGKAEDTEKLEDHLGLGFCQMNCCKRMIVIMSHGFLAGIEKEVNI